MSHVSCTLECVGIGVRTPDTPGIYLEKMNFLPPS